jgi:hypothetical protein
MIAVITRACRHSHHWKTSTHFYTSCNRRIPWVYTWNRTSLKCILIDKVDTSWNSHSCEGSTVSKGTSTDGNHSSRNFDCFQWAAPLKGTRTYMKNIASNCNGFQRAAAIKGVVTLWFSYILLYEGFSSYDNTNRCHTITNCNGCQGFASYKSPITLWL